MTTDTKTKDYALLLEQSLSTIRQLRRKLAEKDMNEPIAIVGMACRFPGNCSTPEKYWEFLKRGGDAVRQVPEDRWDITDLYDPTPGVPGKTYVREAGFLNEDVGEFDARFFGISPLEAAETDPQQRLLLEVSWEALERSGQNISGLKGSRTGVFVGIIGSDYAMLPKNINKLGSYAGTGTLSSVASGRISYVFGFNGPAVSMDTACSSSLVSVHYACESLRRGECDLALAGGVNLMLFPFTFVALCNLRALAADGRCKPFDANGDGYGRAEGCGMVVLKRLSSAKRDKDNILAVIRGSAVNNDGPSSGLTVPNGQAQKKLLQAALANAKVSPHEIGYLEAHGTGTHLGDPIEMQAVSEVFAKRVINDPLIVGAVKGNMGHLEAAAGIAGLLKVVLCLQHQEIPPNIHLTSLNPKIHLDKIPAVIPNKLLQWRQKEYPRMAGISAFGFSGTNAHVIVQEAPEREATLPLIKQEACILAVSAKSDVALEELVGAYKEYIRANPEVQLDNLCYTANTSRGHFGYRAAFIASSTMQLLQQLDAFLVKQQDTNQNNIFRGKINSNKRPKVAFCFSDRCSYVNGMKHLYETQPVFREMFEKCRTLFQEYLQIAIPVYDEWQTMDIPSVLSDAFLFSFQYSLSLLWQSWGIKPVAVCGRRMGGFAAACTAGIISIDDAVLLVCEVGKSRDNVVERDLFGNEQISQDITALFSQVGFQQPKIRFLSCEGDLPTLEDLASSAFWQKQLSVEFEFERGLALLQNQNCGFLVGIGDDPISQSQCNAAIMKSGVQYFSVNTVEQLTNILAKLYVAGGEFDWQEIEQGSGNKKISLPTYPFQRKRYWLDKIPYHLYGLGDAAAAEKGTAGEDPLRPEEVLSPIQERQFHYRISFENLPELKDSHGLIHVGYFQEMLGRAAALQKIPIYTIETMKFIRALIVPEDTGLTIGLLMNDTGEFKFYSLDCEKKSWHLHVQGNIALRASEVLQPIAAEEINTIQRHCKQSYSGADFYKKMYDRGVELGRSVQWIDQVWCKEGEALARFRQPFCSEMEHMYQFNFHPGVLDSCAQLFHAGLGKEVDNTIKLMVINWEEVVFDNVRLDEELWCHIVMKSKPDQSDIVTGTVRLFTAKGSLLTQIKECRMKAISKAREAALKEAVDNKISKNNTESHGLLVDIMEASAEARPAMIERYLQQQVSGFLGMPTNELDINELLSELGMDSLIGIRLQHSIENELNVQVPMEDLIMGPSIVQLCKIVINLLPAANRTGTVKSATPHGCKQEPDRWFAYVKPRAEPDCRLFCLHYGVGGASIYRTWQDKLPLSVEVVPIQLPGRENRIKEKAITNIDEIVDKLGKVLLAKIDLPYAFYGHSMGALISYELACNLAEGRYNKPCHLFVGGFASPQIYPNPHLVYLCSQFKKIGFSGIPDPECIENLPADVYNRLLNSPAVALSGMENETLAAVLLPLMLSDLKIVESYKGNRDKSLEFPITVFHGQEDEMITIDQMEAWRNLTIGGFALHALPGGHLFINEEQGRSEVVKLIADAIDTTLRKSRK